MTNKEKVFSLAYISHITKLIWIIITKWLKKKTNSEYQEFQVDLDVT